MKNKKVETSLEKELSSKENPSSKKLSLVRRILRRIYKILSNVFNRMHHQSHLPMKPASPETAYEWMRPISGAHYATVKTSYKLISYVIISFCFIFIIWSNYFEIDEYVHATGSIEAESENKTISHYEGGIIQEIRIKEGDSIKKDQVLFVLKDETSKASYAESLENYYKRWATIVRLKSQIDKKELVLPKEIARYSPEIAQQTMNQYKNRLEAIKNERKIISDQLDQHQSALKTNIEKIKSLKTLHKLANEREMMMKKLKDKELISKSQHIQAQLDTENRYMDLNAAQNGIAQLEATVSEDKDKLSHVDYAYDTQDWQELKEQEIRFLEAQKAISVGKDRSERSEVKSPIDAIVKEIFEKTVGSAVLAGKPLVTIVPDNDKLIVDALVPPADIGFIRVGNPAVVKISAYDYSIYGSLRGKVEKISADAIQDPKDPQKIFFKIRIRTDQNKITHGGKDYPIKPGLTTQVDIITAKRTVMHYILKPLVKSLEAPLRER